MSGEISAISLNTNKKASPLDEIRNKFYNNLTSPNKTASKGATGPSLFGNGFPNVSAAGSSDTAATNFN